MQPRFVALGAWLTAAAAHPFVQRPEVTLTPPSAPVLAVLSGGHSTAAASAAWSATVLHYANVAPRPDVLEAGIRASVMFDPALQPPLVQGALMVRSAGAPERARPLLELGLHHHPDEAWFPWAIGMHTWIVDDDPEAAADWLDRANSLQPSEVHRRAAETLRRRP